MITNKDPIKVAAHKYQPSRQDGWVLWTVASYGPFAPRIRVWGPRYGPVDPMRGFRPTVFPFYWLARARGWVGERVRRL